MVRRTARFDTGKRDHTAQSLLAQWPCQIEMIPPDAPYLDGADLLIAADCTAYAYRDFHGELMKDRITLIACPRLDAKDYTDKLIRILESNDIRSVKLARMEVSCCTDIEAATKAALTASGKAIPLQIVTISTDGKILD